MRTNPLLERVFILKKGLMSTFIPEKVTVQIANIYLSWSATDVEDGQTRDQSALPWTTLSKSRSQSRMAVSTEGSACSDNFLL